MQNYLLVIASIIATGCAAKQAIPVNSTVSPPPVELLGHGARLPTAEELAQEKTYDARQVARAIEKLDSADVHQRIVATETLNAYQTPESERQLSHILLNDGNAQVRQTAAQSLALFKGLSTPTINALFKALDDNAEKNRQESVRTLLNFTLRLTTDSGTYRQILGTIRTKLSSSSLHPDVHSSLTAFMKDQEPVSNVLFSAPVGIKSSH